MKFITAWVFRCIVNLSLVAPDKRRRCDFLDDFIGSYLHNICMKNSDLARIHSHKCRSENCVVCRKWSLMVKKKRNNKRTKLQPQHLGLRCTCMFLLFVFRKHPHEISISLLAQYQECNNDHPHSLPYKCIICTLDVNAVPIWTNGSFSQKMYKTRWYPLGDTAISLQILQPPLIGGGGCSGKGRI